MKKVLIALSLFAMLITACDNDDFATGAESPILDKLTLSANKVSPGEDVIGTVTYQYPGKDVIKMDYNVQAVNVGLGYDKSVAQGSLIGDNLKSPSFTFKAPDQPGNYRITFSVSLVSVSTGNAQGGPYVTPPSSVFTILTVE